MPDDISTLARQVQDNCHVSDAQHARNYSLCIYLLKMREFFRWEMGYGYGERLPEKALGEWLVERERLWATLEESDYQPLALDGQVYPPFGSARINTALLPHGLAYSGGYGGIAKPHFCLAELERTEQRHGRRILVLGREYARDITAPPAMTQQGEVIVRRESLRRMLWEKLEEWNWRRKGNAMAHALAFYDFERNLDAALDIMTDNETEAVILHEMGEIEAGQLLGAAWEEMLTGLWHTRQEHVARAVRDHLADCLITLPTLLDEGRTASLHFYFANLSGMRQALFPQLQHAYTQWRQTRNTVPLREAITQGQEHWLSSAERMLDIYAEGADNLADRLEQLPLPVL